jgi:hypothetical protein
MGAVTFSIDPRLIAALVDHLPFDIFVETGTFQGETINVIKHYFKQIYSIELSPHYYEKAASKFANDSNVTLMNMDSPSALNRIIPNIQNRPVIFWLDAHWCVADATAGELSQCPLLAELKAINTLNPQSMIIIDDARLFLATPQAPHETSNWPNFHSIIQTLFELSSEHRVSVVNDCILFFPLSVEDQIKKYAQEHGINWLDIINQSRNTDVILAKMQQEIVKLQNMGFWKRIRGLIGYSSRCIKKIIPSILLSR